MTAALFIALEPSGGGSPVTLARVSDRGALVSVAREAIKESRRQTEEMSHEDELLGQLQHEESNRLQRALELVVPELCVTD
jgi:hypothetical protein